MWITGKADHSHRKDALFADLYQECKLAPPAARLSYAIRVRLERFLQPERREIACRMKEGCAPLFIACKKGNVEIVEYLITVCNADVEQRGKYEVPDDRSVHNVTPLWCAAVAGKLPVVKCLVQYGANVDSMSDTGSTPVRSACFMTHLEIVTFLVESGANILRANYNGGTCLINSVQSVPLCEYLLQHGAAVNALDIQHKTALHYAIQEHRLETTKLLLQYQADPFLKSRYGDDALQTSCLKGATQIFEYLIAHVPYSVDRIADAYELMGSTCLDEHHDLQQALQYWRSAVNLRQSQNPPIAKAVDRPAEHFNRAVEFQTLDELDNLSTDLDAMRTQSLLICERILGSTHKDAIFRFMYRGAAYADSLRYQKCIDLWKYALELRVRKDTLLYTETCFAARALVRIFLDLHEKREVGALHEPLRPCDVLSALTLLVDNMETSLELLNIRPVFRRHQDNFDRLLNCLTHLLFLMASCIKPGVTDENAVRLVELVRRLVRIDPRNSNGESLLHLAANRDNTIKSSSYFDEPQGTFFPSLRVARLLVDCGANVSSVDHKRNTPLHTAARAANFKPVVVGLLLERGAHIDQINDDGERPSSMLSKLPGCTIHPLEHQTLQCLAAAVVKAHHLPYKGECPVTLEDFIELH